MINRAVITGRLTKKPDLKYTQSGIAVTQFTVAVNRAFKDSNGERQADFINCVMWRKAAENFIKYVDKGSLVGLDGRIQTRNYENQQGQRVYVTEIVVDNFSLLESRSESEKRNSENANQNQAPSYNSNQSSQSPYSNNNSNNNYNGTNNANSSNSNNNNQSNNSNNNMSDPFAGNSKTIDIKNSDLPF